MRATRILSAIVLVSWPILLAVIVLTSRRFAYSHQKSERDESLSNLKQIGLAIAMYADANQGRCPMDSVRPTLVGSMKLLSNVLTNAKAFHSPKDPRPDVKPESDYAKLTIKNMSYSYVPNLIWGADPDSPVAADRIYRTEKGSKWPEDGNNKGLGGYVLYSDGHVSWNNSLSASLKDKDGKPAVLSPR